MKWVPGEPSTIFLATSLTPCIPCIPPFSCKKTWVILPEVGQIHKKFHVLFQFSLGTRGPVIGTKFTISGDIERDQWHEMG